MDAWGGAIDTILNWRKRKKERQKDRMGEREKNQEKKESKPLDQKVGRESKMINSRLGHMKVTAMRFIEENLDVLEVGCVGEETENVW